MSHDDDVLVPKRTSRRADRFKRPFDRDVVVFRQKEGTRLRDKVDRIGERHVHADALAPREERTKDRRAAAAAALGLDETRERKKKKKEKKKKTMKILPLKFYLIYSSFSSFSYFFDHHQHQQHALSFLKSTMNVEMKSYLHDRKY